MFFRSVRHGRRKAQERLLKLHRRGAVQRVRLGDSPMVYWTGERPGMLAHLVGVNWVRTWLQLSARSWEKMHSFAYEPVYGTLRPDGFAAVRSIATGAYRFCFVELDRGTNAFDKIPKYCRLFDRGGYANAWWLKLTDRFPPILIATTNPRRMEVIKGLIEEQNTSGLEFRVYLLDALRKEVLTQCR